MKITRRGPSSADRERAKDIIVKIVEAAGAEGLVGDTRLYKAFYFAHLFYLDRRQEDLSSWPIARMPHGPGIDQGPDLIHELEVDKVLAADYVSEGPYRSARYRLGDMAGERLLRLDESEQEAVLEAVEFVKSRSAADLSTLTHEHSRAWQSARDGETMDIAVDLLDDERVLRVKRSLEEARQRIRAAFGSRE